MRRLPSLPSSPVPSRRRRTGRRAAAVLVGLTVPVVVAGSAGAAPAAPAAPPRFTPGAAGVGDPYFPLEGNGGYDVGHYDLALNYDPPTHHLAGVATITATATQNLSAFDLDLSGMTVRSVQVNGLAAGFGRQGQELTVTPRSGLLQGTAFTVTVAYAGSPRTVTGSPIVFGASYGWQYTPDGAFVGDEPNAASTWFPCNDHPSDKATFTVRTTVPAGTQVMGNGDLVSTRRAGGSTTYVWDDTSPTATYLVTVDIGRFVLERGTTPAGTPETVGYDPALRDDVASRQVFAQTGAITDFWAQEFGPYAFTSTGAIVDNVPHVGFSLETQTRPLYGFAPDQGTMSHELAHQWFGDDVSVASWDNVWLNEGFATFAAWLWTQHQGGASAYASARSVYDRIPASDAFWNQAVAAPGRDTMFSGAVYQRGGMTLAALQQRIGDPAFFRLLQTWTDQHRYGTATTAAFIALADRISGQRLDGFFDTWLYQKVKPATFG